jgi:hypothetical protein
MRRRTRRALPDVTAGSSASGLLQREHGAHRTARFPAAGARNGQGRAGAAKHRDVRERPCARTRRALAIAGPRRLRMEKVLSPWPKLRYPRCINGDTGLPAGGLRRAAGIRESAGIPARSRASGTRGDAGTSRGGPRTGSFRPGRRHPDAGANGTRFPRLPAPDRRFRGF